MKKILLTTILLLAFLISSCSSNSENDFSDPIVGVWNPFYYTKKNGDRTPYDDCLTRSHYTFKINGAGDATGYNEDVNGNCVIEEKKSFTWVNNQTKTYTLTFTVNGNPYNTDFTMNGSNNEITHYEDVGNGRTGYSDTFKKQ